MRSCGSGPVLLDILIRNPHLTKSRDFKILGAIKKQVAKMSQERKVALVLDLHAHSRRKNVFSYGCRPSKGTSLVDQQVDPVRDPVRVRPFAFLSLAPCLPSCLSHPLSQHLSICISLPSSLCASVYALPPFTSFYKVPELLTEWHKQTSTCTHARTHTSIYRID